MRTGEDNWSPWATGITPGERLARLRSMRTIAMLRWGPLTPIAKPLMMAESLEPADLSAALAALNAFPALDRRHLLASFAKINLPSRKDAA
jgi:hypothetical protein